MTTPMPSKATIKIMVVSQLLGHLSAFNRLVHSGFLVMCCQTISECSSMYYGHDFGMYIFTLADELLDQLDDSELSK